MSFQYGDNLILELKANKDSGRFRSRVLCSYPSAVVISAPFRRGEPITVDDGVELQGVVLRDDATYFFETTVLFTELADQGVTWYLAWPQKLTRVQRRVDIRVEVEIPVEILLIPEDEEKEASRLVSGETINLSASGAKIKTNERLRGNQIKATFFLPETRVRILAVILRTGPFISIKPGDETVKTSYWTALQFLEIAEDKKLEIVKFIFQKQKEKRLKGLI